MIMDRQVVSLFFVSLIFIALWYSYPSSVRLEPPVDKGYCSDCNVILISVDTLRPDFLGAYGGGMDVSPNIDELAQESALFTKAYAQATVTAPSHMSLMTSTYPSQHKICNWASESPRCSHQLDEGIVTLAQVLADDGYRTIAYSGGGNVGGKLGFDRGFHEYHESVDPFDEYLGGGNRKKTYDKMINDLDMLSSERFFMFIHTYKVHDPYYPAEETIKARCGNANSSVISSLRQLNERVVQELRSRPSSATSKATLKAFRDREFMVALTRELGDDEKENARILADGISGLNDKGFFIRFSKTIARTLTFEWEDRTDADLDYLKCLYEAEIHELDRDLGAFFKHLEDVVLMEDTIIIFTSDHGEEFLEHGGFLHEKLYNEIIHVPLMIRDPRDKGVGRVVEGNVRSIDVAPTILDMLNITRPKQFLGKSLVDMMRGVGGSGNVISECNAHAGRSVIEDGMKAISYPEESILFNLSSDPGEEEELSSEHEGLMNQMIIRLNSYLESLEHVRGQPKQNDPDDATVQQLRALGYV
ncbi:sulfatase [Candidatus Altiarchaeota archaeon]